MEKERLIKIFNAIKKDNLKEFSSLFAVNEDLNISFGRFPLLSTLYLFNSYNILSVYESRLLRVSRFQIEDEFFDIYKRFKRFAKKSLRYFVDSELLCYPILMLAVLDKRNELINNYKNLYKTVELTQIIKKIYILNQKIDINISTDSIEIKRKKIPVLQKFKIVTISFMVLLMVAFSSFSIISVGINSGLGISMSPIKISTEQQFVSAMKKPKRNYKLENDIVLTDEVIVNKFSGELDGNGHLITFENDKKLTIKNLSGTIKNININSNLNEEKITQNYAIIAEKSTGKIENVNIFTNIKTKMVVEEDTYISGFVNFNYGKIENSSIRLDAEVQNLGKTNCYLSAFVGENFGKILNSKTVESNISTDTVDTSAFAINNFGEINNSSNNINFSQTSSKEWHPNTSGIVNSNHGKILNTANYGNIFCESTYQVSSIENEFHVYAAGIACQNDGMISNVRNFAQKIEAKSEISILYVGGIVGMNLNKKDEIGLIQDSKSKGNIISKTTDSFSFSGGIAGFNIGDIVSCGVENSLISTLGSVDNSNDILAKSFAGGIVGLNRFEPYAANEIKLVGKVYNSYSDAKFENLNSDKRVLFGGIVGQYDTHTTLNNCHNNHYVKNGGDIYAMNISIYLRFDPITIIGFDPKSANDSNNFEYDSFDEIPNEVKIKDEI